MNYLLIPLALCISFAQLHAQKFGDISKELLEQNIHPSDSSASAAYILDEVDVRYILNNPGGIQMTLDFHSIIKIYDQDGENYGEKEIYLFEQGGKREKVSKLKAVTVNLVDGKIVKNKLDKKDVFQEQYSENYKKKIFALPEVRAGSVIELKYSLTTPYIYTIPKWYFQDYIPVDESNYSIKVPSYFVLTPVPSGFHPLDASNERIKTSNHGEVRYTYKAVNVPAIKEDDYVLNENDYRSGIKYEIRSTRFPGEDHEDYSKDWSEIASMLRKHDKFGKQLNKSYKKLTSIIAEAHKLERNERVKFLYDYVRTNYSWNKNYGVRSSSSLKKIIESKSGNASGINLLFHLLLSKCDITSYPLVMKTRYSGLLNTYFPSLSELNYTITYVEKDDGYMLVDASSEMTPLGELPPRAINYQGVVIKKDSAEVLELTNPNKYKVQTLSKYEYDSEANSLVGTSQRKRSGYAATKFRQDAAEEENESEADDSEEEEDFDEDGQDEDIESYDIENTYELTLVKNLADVYSPISTEYKEELFTCTKRIGDKIFINATLDFGIKKNPFTEEEREYPIFYKSSNSSRTVASLKIPEGYDVESMPEAIKVALPDRAATFSYNITKNGQDLIINYFFAINDSIVLTNEYPALRQLYEIVFDLTKEKIVLTKA